MGKRETDASANGGFEDRLWQAIDQLGASVVPADDDQGM